MTTPTFIRVHYISTGDNLPQRILINVHKIESIAFRPTPKDDYRLVDFIFNDDRRTLVQTIGESKRLEELLDTITIKEPTPCK
jgi:hypothetical protein